MLFLVNFRGSDEITQLINSLIKLEIQLANNGEHCLRRAFDQLLTSWKGYFYALLHDILLVSN